jgi:prepilin-type N-terminal cleavage/methylation domain-containing protein
MSPKYKNKAHHSRGFSLVELLVAMAIFTTLMAGLVVLFSGAVSAYRSAMITRDAHEAGRSMLSVIERDLKSAFTSREHGQYYQFYGTPDGFMFVGLLANGQLGRVTYVLRPTSESPQFETILAEPWIDVLSRTRDQVEAAARNNGQDVVQALADIQAWFEQQYDVDEDGNGLISAFEEKTIYDFPVYVQTASLIRYEEPGRTDLDTFDLGGGITFPYIDPANPNLDDYPANGDAIRGPLYDLLRTGIQGSQYRSSNDEDIRIALELYPSLRPDAIETLLAQKRRQIWIQLLIDSSTLNLPNFWAGKNDLEYVVIDGLLKSASLKARPGIDALMGPALFAYSNGNEESIFSNRFNTAGNIAKLDRTLNTLHGQYRNTTDRTVQSVFGDTKAKASMGSPLDPHLPAALKSSFWYAAEPTRVGGALFKRLFNEVIDVPAGYTRGLPSNI